MQILIAVVALSFLIIIHELGHFTAAKLSGIKVLEFSIFMGPKLFSIQRGETLYSLRVIPIGGFVKMEGEEESSNDDKAFNRKSVGARAAVIASGPIMNLIVAIILLMIVIGLAGYSTNKVGDIDENSKAYEAGIRVGDSITAVNGQKVNHPMDAMMFLYNYKGGAVNVGISRTGEQPQTLSLTPEIYYKLMFTPKDLEYEGADSNVIASLSSDSPAAKAGMIVGDRIIMMNSTDIKSRKDLAAFLESNKDAPAKITILRNDSEKIEFTVAPKVVEEPISGISYEFVEKGSLLNVAKHSFIYAWSTTKSVYYSFAWLIQGKVSLSELRGPIGIVTTIGDVVVQSPRLFDKILNLLNFSAFLSINLGIFNLIPFPALDGSKLLLLGVEGIRRKALPPEKEAFISMIGFAVLILLMVFATYNDIVRQFTGG